jgi:hypothetical protein
VTHYHNPAWTEESRFRGALDDVIIIPLVLVALAANKILRFILSILMRLLDYTFPLAMQIVWLPLFAARENSAKVGFWTSLLLPRYSAPPRRSVVDFERIDMVPHVAAGKTHQRL